MVVQCRFIIALIVREKLYHSKNQKTSAALTTALGLCKFSLALFPQGGRSYELIPTEYRTSECLCSNELN